MSAVRRVTFFQARDYLDKLYDQALPECEEDAWLQDYKYRAAAVVLRYLAEHALYDKCTDDSYGQVTITASSRETIASRTLYSIDAVTSALKQLEEWKLIIRSRGGRRGGRPDWISVRPLLDQAADNLASIEQHAVKDKANRLPAENLVLATGMVFRIYSTKYQLGKKEFDDDYGTTSWEVWCREQTTSAWHPGTRLARKDQWWVWWQEREIRENATSWWLAEEY
jgi:DNA-binding MarR family transcriptional regulator